MVAAPPRVALFTLWLAIIAWLWGLAGVLFHIRWHSVERPLPKAHEAFPYGEIRIGVDASYPPFAVATANDLFGLDIDLGNALAEAIDFPVRFVNMGYDGLYDSVRADQVDILISALLVDERLTSDVYYTHPYIDAGLVLVTAPDSSIQGIEDVGGSRLAYEFGSPADSEAREWSRRLEDFTTMPYELPEFALDALRLGQADATLVDAISYRLYLREHPDWESKSTVVTSIPIAIAIRRDRDETWRIINETLIDMIEDGRLDAILKRWL